MHDVRQAGFAVHKLARQAPDELTTAVLRVVGQAIGTGHMPEHAMVASDYAIKVIISFIPAIGPLSPTNANGRCG